MNVRSLQEGKRKQVKDEQTQTLAAVINPPLAVFVLFVCLPDSSGQIDATVPPTFISSQIGINGSLGKNRREGFQTAENFDTDEKSFGFSHFCFLLLPHQRIMCDRTSAQPLFVSAALIKDPNQP